MCIGIRKAHWWGSCMLIPKRNVSIRAGRTRWADVLHPCFAVGEPSRPPIESPGAGSTRLPSWRTFSSSLHCLLGWTQGFSSLLVSDETQGILGRWLPDRYRGNTACWGLQCLPAPSDLASHLPTHTALIGICGFQKSIPQNKYLLLLFSTNLLKYPMWKDSLQCSGHLGI